MFKVAKQQTFTHEVKVHTPVDGGYRLETISATFELLPIEERTKFDLGNAKGTQAFLKRAVRKLDGLIGENDQALPYSDELRDQLIDLPHVRQALAAAYFDAVANDPKAGN